MNHVLIDKSSRVSLACFPRKKAIVSPPRFVLAFQRPAVCKRLGRKAPELFRSIERFQPAWWRLTIPVKMKTTSHLLCAEMWNNTHNIRSLYLKYQTVFPFVPAQKRSSCCGQHPTPQCSVTTLTFPVQTSLAMWQVFVPRRVEWWKFRSNYHTGCQNRYAPPCWNGVKLHHGLDLLWSNPGWKTGHAIAKGIPVEGALCLPMLSLDPSCSCSQLHHPPARLTNWGTNSCIIMHPSTVLSYPPPIHWYEGSCGGCWMTTRAVACHIKFCWGSVFLSFLQSLHGFR